MLRQLDKNLWVAEQPLRYFGLPVGTRMTVIRLDSGELCVISPIASTDRLVTQLNSLGSVRYLISPNRFHHLFMAEFQQVYPAAEFWAVPGLLSKRPDLKPDRCFDRQPGNFEHQIDYLPFEGLNTIVPSGITSIEEMVFLHRASRTLILTDIAFHFTEQFPWSVRLGATLLRCYKHLRPAYVEKLANPDRSAIQTSVQQILNWDFDRVIMAHGEILERDGKSEFRRGYEWFLGKAIA